MDSALVNYCIDSAAINVSTLFLPPLEFKKLMEKLFGEENRDHSLYKSSEIDFFFIV